MPDPDLPSSRWLDAASRILVRSVNWLGDAVMATPALLRLREAYPKAHIVLLAPAKLEDLWRHHPAVDAVLGMRPQETVWQVARNLRRGQFDLALVLPNSPRSALESFLAGIPRRVGHARPWRNWLLTHPVPARAGEVAMHKRSVQAVKRLIDAPPIAPLPLPATAHHLFQYLHLVAALGANPAPLAPQLALLESERQEARQGLASAGQARAFWLGLCPGAEYGPAKRWPAERFAAAAREVHRWTRCGCVLLGGAHDAPAAAAIARQLERAGVTPVVDLAGRTTLRQVCALLSVCRVVLSNDSGAMHVAAAVGTPVVVPFGSTSAALTGPGLPGSLHHAVLSAGVPCAPCFRRECPIDLRCLNHITVEQVVAAILERVRRTAPIH